jgi:hypothetical protein
MNNHQEGAGTAFLLFIGLIVVGGFWLVGPLSPLLGFAIFYLYQLIVGLVFKSYEDDNDN